MIKIGGLQKFTLIDFPGKIACTVFFLGCNFRCPFCHNPELVLPEKFDKNTEISEKDFFDFLKQRKTLLEAVVLCGGEPTIFKDLPTFCARIKKMGFLVKLDTNGSNPDMIKNLIARNLVDYIAMDVKAPFGVKVQSSLPTGQAGKLKVKSSKYERAVGIKVDLGKIKKSIEMIKNSGVDYEFRTTIVPGIHTKQDIIQIAKEISPAKKYYLQNFRVENETINPKFQNIKPYPEKYILDIKKAVAPFFEICEIR